MKIIINSLKKGYIDSNVNIILMMTIMVRVVMIIICDC